MTIPLFKPSCTDEEVDAVTRVLRSGWWGMGAEVEAFEEEFAAYTGARYAVAVNSGTAALELAARVIAPSPRTWIVPALTFVSSAQALLHAGHKVIFADIDEDTLTIDWSHVEELTESYEFGVLPVWYGGTVTNVPWSFAANPVLEDCAHAAGSRRAGSLGNAAAWSFHAVKNLATGDGGMVTTNDESWRDELRRLRWLGIDRSTWDRDKDARVGYGWDYNIVQDGEKAHMNDLTAALGRVQLKRLGAMNSARYIITQVYQAQLTGLDWLSVPPLDRASSNHLYVVRVPAEERPRFIRHMIDSGVSAGVHYKPLNHYPQLFGPQHLPEYTPVAECVWQTLVTLPLYPDMTIGDALKVIDTVRSFKI